MTDTYATQKELETAEPTVIPVDVLDSHLHSFFTAYTKQTREVGYAVTLNPAGGYILGGSGELAGYNIMSTAGATVTLHDGPDISFPPIVTLVIAANSYASTWLLPGGLHYDRGISLEVTGLISGTIYTRKTLAL